MTRLSLRIPQFLRPLLRPLLDPYRRFRHAKLIHAVRVSLGLVATIVLTTGMNLPHGEWASITMLIVIGGLQHHGNIRKKAQERAYGTLIGAGLGILVILQQAWLGIPILTYLLMASLCGFFAYHAIGKGGYLALLSAITLFIVAGHGYNPIEDALWRLVDIIIGLVMALLFSFALPLYAAYSWRYTLAAGIRDCAEIHSRIAGGQPVNDDEHQKLVNRANNVLIQLRSLLPSVSKEVRLSQTRLDAIQHDFRLCICTLELLASSRPKLADDAALLRLHDISRQEHRQIRHMLVGMSRALRNGASERLAKPGASNEAPVALPADSAEYSGYILLTQQLATTVDGLRQKLAESARRWKF